LNQEIDNEILIFTKYCNSQTYHGKGKISTELKLSSYLYERQKFGCVVSTEVFQLKAL